MNFLITGGTGFIGKKLVTRLQQDNHHTYILTRTPEKQKNDSLTTYFSYTNDFSKLPPIHTVINLAGESLFGYWTKQKKEAILKSRVKTTEKVVNIIQQLQPKPTLFISGSAVGFYGTSEDIIFTEKTESPGGDFLANVVDKWENIAKQTENVGVRTVFTRFGIVLGQEGSLPLMTLPVKLMMGGKIGSGNQWMSWIHIDDAIDLILFAIQNVQIDGPLNLTAPHPLRNKDFMKTIADVLRRPFWFPTPSRLFRTITGEMSHLILKGQFVLPKKAEDNGFQFTYPTLESALRQLYVK